MLKTDNDDSRANESRLFGLYLGSVSDNQDPERRGRVKVRVPEIIPDDAHPTWALPVGVNYGDSSGTFILPDVGAVVYVQFLSGDPNQPTWQHGPFAKEKKPRIDSLGDQKRMSRILYQSKAGTFVLEQRSGDMDVTLPRAREFKITGEDTWFFLETNPNGKLEINQPKPEQGAARKGDRVDCGSLSVTMGPNGVVAVLWTPPEAGSAPIPLSVAPTPVHGIIAAGSSTVKIGD